MAADAEIDPGPDFTSDEGWQRLARIAYRAAYKIVENREDSEDIAQNVLAARWLAGGTVFKPEAWVTRAATRMALNLLRNRRREILTAPTEIHAPRPSPDHADQVIGHILLDHWLQELSPSQRDVLRARFQDDLTLREVADLLKVSLETVRTHTRRAIRRIRPRVTG